MASASPDKDTLEIEIWTLELDIVDLKAVKADTTEAEAKLEQLMLVKNELDRAELPGGKHCYLTAIFLFSYLLFILLFTCRAILAKKSETQPFTNTMHWIVVLRCSFIRTKDPLS